MLNTLIPVWKSADRKRALREGKKFNSNCAASTIGLAVSHSISAESLRLQAVTGNFQSTTAEMVERLRKKRKEVKRGLKQNKPTQTITRQDI